MSASEVLEQFGTRRLVAFVAALALFLVLHLVRMPFLLMARLLEAAMARVDHWVTASVSTPASAPGPGGGCHPPRRQQHPPGRGSPPHHHGDAQCAGVVGEAVG